MITEPSKVDNVKSEKEERARLFQEEFTIQDLHYDLVKKFNFRKIAGPSLR